MMNKRIKELAEQATIKDKVHHYTDIPSWYLEKFAELIVKECIQQMQIERGNPYRNMADIEDFAIGAIDESIRRVKEHFGVEE
jgi:hypothetical protein